jgi:hypothetical protein
VVEQAVNPKPKRKINSKATAEFLPKLFCLMTLPPFDELIKSFYHPMARKARTNKKRALS